MEAHSSSEPREKLPHHFSLSYWRNNLPFLAFLYFIICLNIAVMIQRAYYFKDFSLREEHPRIGAWFDAMETARPPAWRRATATREAVAQW